MAEDLPQNGVAFPTTHGMLNKETAVTQGGIGRLWLIAPWRVGMLFPLARLLGRAGKPITPVVSWPTTIASIDPDRNSCKPVYLRRERLFEHAVIVLMPAKRPPEQEAQLLWERHARGLEQRPFCCRWSPHAVWRLLANDARHVRGRQ
jgi:hypothetical protein